ncbi:WD40-repeat-containing domain protein [Phycomyces nitens]|nr:WD40-repeat-containing domain protein [Phycomyces nitens]
METNGDPEESQLNDENPQIPVDEPINASASNRHPDNQDPQTSNEQHSNPPPLTFRPTNHNPHSHQPTKAFESAESSRIKINNEPASQSSEEPSGSQSYGWGKVTSLLPFLGSASSERSTKILDSSTQRSFVQQKDSEKKTLSLPKNGTVDEYSDDDLACPICHEIMKDVFMTVCGHSYCHVCISQHIKMNSDCPLCRANVSPNKVYPNFQLNRVAEQRTRILAKSENNANLMASLYPRKGKEINYELLAERLSKDMSQQEILTLFNKTLERCKRIESDDSQIRSCLLKIFLVKFRERNEEAIKEMVSQLLCIEEDLKSTGPDEPIAISLAEDSSILKHQLVDGERTLMNPVGSKRGHENIDSSECEQEENQLYVQNSLHPDILEDFGDAEMMKKKQKIEDRFDDLRELYLGTCRNTRTPESIDDFSSMLYQVTRYSQFKVLDTLYYTDVAASSSIVSSIEFDRDDEYFAVGGVTKEIKIYDFSMMGDGSGPDADIPENEHEENTESQDVPERTTGDSSGGYVGRFRPSAITHCPVSIMRCNHKISCLSWNTYIKSQIASSDYEGVVNIWDASTGTCIRGFSEHKRRVWSVDTCSTNPLLLASGSDDSTVKIWSTQMRHSIHTLGQKGNVCCAKFAPNSSYKLAVGSADHNISCYDLRFPNKPFRVFKGHKKAVSYVQWASNDEIVSASTDNTLKLWNLGSKDCIRTFTGHQNEKNFVGLSLNEDWIACGSETNTLYMYYKGSRIPVANYKFPDMDNTTGNETGETDPAVFVSSVCWKNNSTRIVAANSKGMIKVLCLE